MENQFNADFGPADGHWTARDREAILTEAFRRLEESAPADEGRRREIWHDIVVDFHRGRSWGRTPTPGRAPKEKKPAGDERWRLLLPYIWAFLQATIVMKLVIYYFGINSADDPSAFNFIGLGVGIFLSFASLILFAFRHHRKMKKRGLEDTE